MVKVLMSCASDSHTPHAATYMKRASNNNVLLGSEVKGIVIFANILLCC